MKVTTLQNCGVPTQLAEKIAKAINEKWGWREDRTKKLTEETISTMSLKKMPEDVTVIRWIYSEEDQDEFPYNCYVVYKDPKGNTWVMYKDLYALVPAEVDPEIY